MEILKYLEKSRIVSSFTILDFRNWEIGLYLKLKITLIDGSNLFVREFSDKNERNYSYHWQNSKGELIIRWDNAPHYPEHKTFPHHKHIKNELHESNEITLNEVLKFIEKNI